MSYGVNSYYRGWVKPYINTLYIKYDLDQMSIVKLKAYPINP